MTLLESFIMLLTAVLTTARDVFQSKVQSYTCLGLWGITCLMVLVIMALVIVARDRGSK